MRRHNELLTWQASIYVAAILCCDQQKSKLPLSLSAAAAAEARWSIVCKSWWWPGKMAITEMRKMFNYATTTTRPDMFLRSSRISVNLAEKWQQYDWIADKKIWTGATITTTTTTESTVLLLLVEYRVDIGYSKCRDWEEEIRACQKECQDN